MKDYNERLEALQLALVRWQQHCMACGDKVVIVFEGRDAAGKDGAIQRLTEHLSVRNTRVVALPKPSDLEKTQWFFQRFVRHLPGAGETVIFNRSWYNRGGVEKVMGFSTPAEQAVFLDDAPVFEKMITDGGVKLVKLWLDISKDKQVQRLHERATDPLKVLKTSPLDEFAQSRWDAYTAARDEMITRTDSKHAPWVCVRADQKKQARVAILAHLVHTLAPAKVKKGVEKPDSKVLFPFAEEAVGDGRLER